MSTEHEPRDDHDDEQPPLPGEDAHNAGEALAAPAATVTFGSLELIPPKGNWWGEWIVTRGIEEAERERRPVDNRVAYYLASFFDNAAHPALRNLAATGAIDGPGIQEELVSNFIRRGGQVLPWIERLAEYCMAREDRGPVENWRSAIREQDRVEVQWLRREHVFASIDDLFQQVSPIQRVDDAGKPGWHGLVYHEDRAGGWIVSEGEGGTRRVWETDSDAELDRAYVAIVHAQRQWVEDTFGRAPSISEQQEPEVQADQRGDAPESADQPDAGQ